MAPKRCLGTNRASSRETRAEDWRSTARLRADVSSKASQKRSDQTTGSRHSPCVHGIRPASAPQPKSVLVVGGGIVGASTAYYLNARGVRVTVLEQVGVACHSSGKAAGQLSLGWNDGPGEDLAVVSFALHAELAAKFGAENIGYRRASCVGLGFGGDDPEQGRPWLDKIGRITPYTMGTETSMGQVHPKKLTESLIKASEAEVIIGKAVAIERDADRVVGVRTEGGQTICCEAVLFAMGAWAMQISEWFPELGKLLDDTVGKKYTSVVWDAVCDNTIAYLENYHIQIVPRPDEVYACGCPVKEELPANPLDIVPEEEHVAKLCEEVAETSTKLANASVKVVQACFLPSSADSRPVLGLIPSTSNAYVACGHSCWGILWGPASGKAMSEVIIDGEASCVDISAFDPRREPMDACILQ